MAQVLDPIEQRDFSAGRIAKSAVATALMPNYSTHSLTSAINSVANSINVDFSEIIGSGIVRKGKQDILQMTGQMKDGQAERIATSGSDLVVEGATEQAQTFTPIAGQNVTYGIALKLYFVGTIWGLVSPPNVIVSLQTTSAGKPTGTLVNNNSWTFNAGLLTSNTAGQVYLFPTNPGTTLSTGVTYAIVIDFPNGDSGDEVKWVYNSGTVYAGGQSLTSTNSGTTWSVNTGAAYFAQEILDPAPVSPYNIAPLGNWSFLSNNVKKNVVGFLIHSSGLDEGAIFYYNTTNSTWEVSNLFTLSKANIRFANMDGYVYEANGIQLMKSSVDFGATWTITNSIFPYAIDTAAPWDNSISYGIGALVQYGSFYYSSLINPNLNHTPTVGGDDNWEQLAPIYPSLLIVSGNRLLASGVSTYPSRVYFSSLVDPVNPANLTWNIDPTAGDFFDIDPDSGGIVTALANVSTLTLVFKNNGMYRLNAVSKTVDPENVFNVGCVSQEAVTSCLGIVYFYSGDGIYSTDSTFPQNLSRIGVQDFVDAIADPLQVYAYADEFNVYFSIGNVTLSYGPEDFRTYSNVVLKFSPRDQNWQVFSYNQRLAQTTEFGVPPATLLATEYNGALANVNTNTISDDGTAIPFELETQEQELGNRSHTKNISDKMVVYTRNGNNSAFSIKENDGNFKSANMILENRVNVGTDINFAGQFFTFKWQGQALGSRPEFQGFHLPMVTDLGITLNDNE